MPSRVPSCAVVVTTIGDGGFLNDYFSAAREEDCLDGVEFIVIPDRKTPAALFERCREFTSRGMRVRCPSIDEQDRYLARLNLADFVPYDSDNRRNIGYLMALESGAEFTISIDDDNYARPGSRFFAEHAVVVREHLDAAFVNSSNGWFNICQLMNLDGPPVYPRGSSQVARDIRVEDVRAREAQCRPLAGRARPGCDDLAGVPDARNVIAKRQVDHSRRSRLVAD